MNPDELSQLKPGPSAVGGPRPRAGEEPRGGGTAAEQLKSRLYTKSGRSHGQSMQTLPGASMRSSGSKTSVGSKTSGGGGGGFGGTKRGGKSLRPRGMVGSRSVPALGGLLPGMSGTKGGGARGGARAGPPGSLLTNNFLPEGVPAPPQRANRGSLQTMEAPGSKTEFGSKTETSAAGAGGGDTTTTTAAAAYGGRLRRTDQTFTQMLQLDKATLREFLRGDFLYLKGDSDAVSVYDLHVVNHDEVTADGKSGMGGSYWTMSRAGLTQFFHSKPDAIGPDAQKDPEFTDLEIWERDFHIFNVIQGIRFFKQYPMWKSFRMWSKGMKRRKMQHGSRSLNQKLFLLNDTLRTSMSQLRRLCVDVSQLGLFTMPTKEKPIVMDGAGAAGSTDDGGSGGALAGIRGMSLGGGAKKDLWQPPTVEIFLKEQVKKRALLADWLIDFSDDVRALVRSACDQVLDAFLARNHIEADHPMTFTEKAALRTECRRLVKFVRLCDMLIRDTLLEVGIESTEALLEYLHPSVPSEVVTIVHEIEEPTKGKKKEREVKDFDEEGHRIYEDGTTSEDERDEEEKMEARARAAAHPCEVRLMLNTEMFVKTIETKSPKVSPNSSPRGEEQDPAAAAAAGAEAEAEAAAAEAEAEAAPEEKKEGDEAAAAAAAEGEGAAVEEEFNVVQLCESDLRLTITEGFLVEELLQCVDDAIRVLAVPEPIMTHEDLQPYIRGANAEGASASGGGDGGEEGGGVVPIDQQVQWSERFKGAKRSIQVSFRFVLVCSCLFLFVLVCFFPNHAHTRLSIRSIIPNFVYFFTISSHKLKVRSKRVMSTSPSFVLFSASLSKTRRLSLTSALRLLRRRSMRWRIRSSCTSR